jgi:toxin ParE1/3/4
MNLPVVLRQKARAEFDAAFDWCERQQPGLGPEFAERVQVVFDRISATPEMHVKVYRDVRKALVRTFPYLIYYRVRADHVVVLAVFHNKRNPNIWKSRACPSSAAELPNYGVKRELTISELDGGLLNSTGLVVPGVLFDNLTERAGGKVSSPGTF